MTHHLSSTIACMHLHRRQETVISHLNTLLSLQEAVAAAMRSSTPQAAWRMGMGARLDRTHAWHTIVDACPCSYPVGVVLWICLSVLYKSSMQLRYRWCQSCDYSCIIYCRVTTTPTSAGAVVTWITLTIKNMGIWKGEASCGIWSSPIQWSFQSNTCRETNVSVHKCRAFTGIFLVQLAVKQWGVIGLRYRWA